MCCIFLASFGLGPALVSSCGGFSAAALMTHSAPGSGRCSDLPAMDDPLLRVHVVHGRRGQRRRIDLRRLGGCARRPLVPLAPGEGDVRRPLRIASRRRTHPCSSCVNWRRFLKPGIGVAVVLLAFAFVLPKLADYREVWSELKDLDAAALALLAAVTALNLATFQRPAALAALPGIGFCCAHSESPRRRQHPRTSPPEVPRWGWE